MGDASVGVRGGPDRPDGAGGVRETFVTSDGQTATTLNFFFRGSHTTRGPRPGVGGRFLFLFCFGRDDVTPSDDRALNCIGFLLVSPREANRRKQQKTGWSGWLVDWSIGRLVD